MTIIFLVIRSSYAIIVVTLPRLKSLETNLISCGGSTFWESHTQLLHQGTLAVVTFTDFLHHCDFTAVILDQGIACYFTSTYSFMFQLGGIFFYLLTFIFMGNAEYA